MELYHKYHVDIKKKKKKVQQKAFMILQNCRKTDCQHQLNGWLGALNYTL